MKPIHTLVAAFVAAAFSCNTFAAVGPNYHRPSTPSANDFADAEPGTWKEATPADAIARGDWWKIFNDPVLDDLERQATSNNQDLKAAVARVSQARALARSARADFFPSVSFEPSAFRGRSSDNVLNGFPSQTGNDFRVPLDLSYELDVWGRVRRSFEAANADAQARLAAFEIRCYCSKRMWQKIISRCEHSTRNSLYCVTPLSCDARR